MTIWQTLKERAEFEGGWFSFILGSFVMYGVIAFWIVAALVLLSLIF